MTFPRFGPSRGHDAAQFASHARNGRLEDDSGQGFPFPGFTSHPTATLRTPRAAANQDGRIQAAELGQQESFEQYFTNTSLWTSAAPQGHLSHDDGADARRASDSSETTLCDQTEEDRQRSLQRVSLSSHRHPNNIASPPNVYIFGDPPRSSVKRRSGHRSSLDESDYKSHFRDEDDASLDDVDREAPLHRGVVSNLLELSHVSRSVPNSGHRGSSPTRSGSFGELVPDMRPGFSRMYSLGGYDTDDPDMRPRLSRLYSLGGYDADDPRVTGATRELLDDPADLERNVKDQMGLRTMSYKQRRKEAQKIKIRFFVTCMSRGLRRGIRSPLIV